MRIAVTYKDDCVFPHFGHTEQFKIYEVINGKIKNVKIIETNGNGHSALAGLLESIHVDTLICDRIGAGAKTALSKAGIVLYNGVQGDTDEAVVNLLTGKLAYNPNVSCDHRSENCNCKNHLCEEHGM